MALWIKPEQKTEWSRQDFKLDSEPLISAAVEQAKQSFQEAAQPVRQAPWGAALTSFAVPSLESLTSGWITKPQPEPAATTATDVSPAQTGAGRTFSIPGLESLTSGWGALSPATAASSPAENRPSAGAAGSSDFNTYVRESSAQRGLDPDQVLKVVGKEGPTGWTSVGRFDTGESYGPLQLHYGGGSNPKQGMGDDFTKATGIDLRKVDANTPEGIRAHQAAVDFALDRLSKTGDYREWYGAGPALGDRFTKVNRVTPVAPAQPAPAAGGLGAAQPAAQPSGAPAWGTYTKDTLVDNQVTAGAEQGLTPAEALAVCGPAASVAFARAVGRQPTLREAKELGARLGVWSQGQGMAGPASTVTLMQNMGVNAELQQGANEGAIASEIQAGRPVVLDSPGHYWVATAYDPQTRQFEFGQSAGVLKASGGRTRYRLDELASLGMGAPRATILLRGAR